MEKLNISFDNIYKIFKMYKGRLDIDGKSYYFKPNESNMELVVERLARQLGISTVHYITQKVGPDSYYFSEDLNNTGDFTTADELGLVGDSLQECFKLFKSRYPDLEYFLSMDLIKVYMMDILLMNHDRHSDNWGIYKDNEGIRLVILDNDLCFTISKTVLSSKNIMPYYMRKYYDSCVVVDSYDDLENFFREFGPSFRRIFISMYDLLTPDYIRATIDSVEKEYGVIVKAKEMYISLYETHYAKLGEICKNKTIMYK